MRPANPRRTGHPIDFVVTLPAGGRPAAQNASRILRAHSSWCLLGRFADHDPRAELWRWQDSVDNLLGRGQVFLDQEGRQGQDVADVIEPVADVVRREIVRRLKLDADEVANGIVVLRD